MSIDSVARAIKRDAELDPIERTWLHAQLQGVVDGDLSKIGPIGGIEDAWKGEPCFLVGGSKGLKNAMDAGFRLDMLDGFHSIGVNHVVEDYHRFEWLLVMDKRFFTISPYDVLNEYEGRLFAHNKAGLPPSEHVTVFYTQGDGPARHFVDGLYTFVVSGLTAMNLALLSGANPVYMLGLDNGGLQDNKGGTHYKAGYTGESVGKGNWRKFKTKIPERMLDYLPWADRFINVDPMGDITAFKKMDVRDVPELKEKFA
jgi:hypothetical protein